MSLTAAQQATLATNINSAGNAAALGAFITAKDWPAIANFYNQPSSPALAVWRSGITPGEVTSAIVYSDFVALTAIRQNGLLVLLQGNVDATIANVRNSFTSIFGAGSATLTNMTALAQRTATRIEALFASGGPPAVSTLFGYVLSPDDVQHAMGA